MDDFQELVYTRLQSFPKGYNISIGSYGTITKEEALSHVAKKDKIGHILMQVDREYFDALKSGEFYAGITH